MKKIYGVCKALLQFKNISFCFDNATPESVNCSLFLKNLEKHFCNLTYKNNFVKHVENLPQHLSEKCVGDNSSITDIAFRNRDLSIIGIAQSFFEIIDYRYRFIAKRFIVPFTMHIPVVHWLIRIRVFVCSTSCNRGVAGGGGAAAFSIKICLTTKKPNTVEKTQ